MSVCPFFVISRTYSTGNKLPSVLPRNLGRPGGFLTDIFNSVCTKLAAARIKLHEDLGI